MGAQSKTSARRVRAKERQALALKLRASGATFAAIGEHLEITAQSAHALVKHAIEDIPAEALSDLRAVELARLDRLTAAVWKDATGGDIKAIGAVVLLMQRRAKLTGLDAPVLTDDVSDWTDEELLDYAESGKRPTRRSRATRNEAAGVGHTQGQAASAANPMADAEPVSQ